MGQSMSSAAPQSQVTYILPLSPMGIALVVATSVFLLLAIIAVALRIWAIVIIRRKYRLHDYLIFAGLVCCPVHASPNGS